MGFRSLFTFASLLIIIAIVSLRYYYTFSIFRALIHIYSLSFWGRRIGEGEEAKASAFVLSTLFAHFHFLSSDFDLSAIAIVIVFAHCVCGAATATATSAMYVRDCPKRLYISTIASFWYVAFISSPIAFACPAQVKRRWKLSVKQNPKIK